MRLLVLGAAGRTGREVVKQALARGWVVTAFVRNDEKLEKAPNLKIVVGDAQVAAQVKAAFKGCDAVISTLGHTSLAESRVQTIATKAILDIAPINTRFVTLTGIGVEDDKDPDLPFSSLLVNIVIKNLPGGRFADGEAHVNLLKKSSVQWTVLRAARLSQGAKTGKYRLGFFKLGANDAVARADVATAMLDVLTGRDWIRQSPMIRSN